MPDFSDIPQDHPTPSLVVDIPTVRRNIERMQEYGNKNGLKIRPHTKTHKSRFMAQLQLDRGACGLTVAKAGEAEVMSAVCEDIFVAYPAIGHARMSKLMETARHARIRVAIDSIEAASLIDAFAKTKGVKIGALIDIDVGFHRTGTSGKEATLALAEQMSGLSSIQFEGLMVYPGHLLPTAPEQMWKEYEDLTGDVVQSLREKGFAVDVVSGGSTPTALASHRNRWQTEIRPGTYIYNDLNEVRLGVASYDDCAAQILSTVISHCGKNKFVIDAGSKTLSSDRCGPAPDSGWGFVVEHPLAKVVRLSEEHGEVQLEEGGRLPQIGSRVTIIPNHICVCVNLQNKAWARDRSELMELPIDGRGMLV